MSDYTKLTDFASKDTLPSGNANKIVKGTEIDDEFEAIETAVATKANIASPSFTGTPTAPTAADGTNTTQIATTAFVLTNGVPSGAILMWSGSVASIPSGWSLCDGTNSTPDLRNRFVVGAGDTYSVDATGGSADAIVVSHTHTITDPGHQHDGTAYYRGEGLTQTLILQVTLQPSTMRTLDTLAVLPTRLLKAVYVLNQTLQVLALALLVLLELTKTYLHTTLLRTS